MKVLIIGLVVVASVVAEIEETKNAGDQDPPVVDPREGPGLRFAVRVEFSRVWESSERIRRFARQGSRPRSSAKDDLDGLITKFDSSDQSNDPLHVVCRVDCTAVQPDGWLAVLSVARVSYRDVERRRATGRVGHAQSDRSWRIDSKTLDRKRAATSVIEDLSLAWRFPFTTAEEQSVLESQLAAAALVFLESRPLKVRFDPLRSELSFPDIDQLLTNVLPEEFPLALLDRVAWFLHEALVRGVGPGSRALASNGRFTFRGVAYEVERSRRATRANGLLVRAQLKRARSGLALKESALLKRGTGHTVEARGIVVYAPRLGETKRFGATRWHIRREDR